MSLDQAWLISRARKVHRLHQYNGTQTPKIISYSSFQLPYNHANIYLNGTSKTTYNENDFFMNDTITDSAIIFAIVYGLVALGGVLANTSIVITLCSQTSERLRNPLLVALCLADLLVTGVSAPIAIVTLALWQKTWTISSIGCKTAYYFQIMPVAASNLCFLLLSLDRYATVRHPRIRQHKFMGIFLAAISWISAIGICIPYILVNQLTILQKTKKTIAHIYIICRSNYDSNTFRLTFIIAHTILVFLIPSFGVLINHIGVKRKLCGLALINRAAYGELPLPMPILRRPTHMIIVTGLANGPHSVISKNTSDDIDRQDNGTFVMQKLTPGKPSTKNSVERKTKLKNGKKSKRRTNETSGLSLPRTSTLQARRKLANILIAAALIFIGCWAPHVTCTLLTEFNNKDYCSRNISLFSLLLGYAHSAINPIIFWALNNNTLRQSTCATFFCLHSIQKFFRIHFRPPSAQPPPSSTNEAALGPFNPKYIKSTPKQYRAQASSHYLY